jgi:hypothetical protein
MHLPISVIRVVVKSGIANPQLTDIHIIIVILKLICYEPIVGVNSERAFRIVLHQVGNIPFLQIIIIVYIVECSNE